MIDRFTNRVSSLHLALGQVTVCAALVALAVFAEKPTVGDFKAAFLPRFTSG